MSFITKPHYLYTTQAQLRKEFRAIYRNQLSFRKIPHYAGFGKMYCTDTRCAWVDWIDYLSKCGAISRELAQRATL